MRETAFDLIGAEIVSTHPLLPLRLRGVGLTVCGNEALRDLDLTLGPGGCTVIMGPNGAGKSLLLKVMHGLIAPTIGTVTWAGRIAANVTHRQALVFQAPVLLRRSAAANIDFVLRTRRRDPTLRDRLLTRVGLSSKAHCTARQLSGGEQQRLALARALATDPEVLLLDEPTASLDPASVLMIEEIVAEARARGTRIVFVTHDLGQARRMADEVVFLHRGQVVEHRPAAAFFAAPETEAARAYLAGRIVL